MKFSNSPKNSIFTLYVVWSAVLILHGSWVVFTSGFDEKVGEENYTYFLFMFYFGFFLFFVIGGFFAWFAQLGKTWALWLFTAYCLYRAIDFVFGVIVSESLGEIAVDVIYWVKNITISAIWLLLAGFAWYLRPNKSLKSVDA